MTIKTLQTELRMLPADKKVNLYKWEGGSLECCFIYWSGTVEWLNYLINAKVLPSDNVHTNPASKVVCSWVDNEEVNFALEVDDTSMPAEE